MPAELPALDVPAELDPHHAAATIDRRESRRMNALMQQMQALARPERQGDAAR